MFFQSFYSFDTYYAFNLADNCICFIFLAEWVGRFIKSKNKREFMKFGWIDLLCSIPAFGAWNEHYVLLRILRTVRSFKYLAWFIVEHPKTTKFFAICTVSFLFLCTAAVSVFNCEKHAEGANIKSPGDALWWGIVTISTVGYGDKYPVSDAGRLVASLVILGGAGLFSVITAYITSKFIQDHKVDAYREKVSVTLESLFEEVKNLQKQNAELKDIVSKL